MPHSGHTFEISHALPKGARVGVIHTPHGSFNTPAFVAVGTKGTVKSVLPSDMAEKAKLEVSLANTYHLFLQPGEEIVAKAGGLHSFMDWHKPLMTDSGGFQVFSLGVGYEKDASKFVVEKRSENANEAVVFDESIKTQHAKLALVDDEGVTFTSHIDGTLYRFTPERSVEIQHMLGADIFFAFDDFVLPDAPRDEQVTSMRRTHAWAERSLNAHRDRAYSALLSRGEKLPQAIYGIVQGGRYMDLRAESARIIGSMDFDGYGIGGTFSKADLGEALISAIKNLPSNKPRHLLGIGEPEDIFEAVSHGIDSFDCVQPTRLARTGTMYTARGKINLLNEKYATDFSELDTATGGYASEHFSKAYVSHLFRAKEMLGATILSIHNLYFLTKLMDDIRSSIVEDKFEQFRASFLQTYKS
ncbi:tRNA guanosine(34) transglycosylase Tgt [Patescibacteria group bacterium]|nr:MAG: tRNA guanosine(34) transglycosylase Tgt [Patescibacteria group bacterium]